MAKVYCVWCGTSYSSLPSLTNGLCSKNPDGKHHVLYEGSEKAKYECKFCGTSYSSLPSLTNGSCSKSPHKKHFPRN
jgi:hypothetical protein